MSRTVDNLEQLRHRVQEVEDLGHKEQQEGLGEVAENTNNRKDHAGEVAVGVSNKTFCRAPVVSQRAILTARNGSSR